MPTFGNANAIAGTPGNTATGLGQFFTDRLYGVKAAPASSGTVDSVTAYVQAQGTGKTFKPVILLASDGSILTNGVGNSVSLDSVVGAPGFVTATFSTPPSVAGGVDYFVCIVGGGGDTWGALWLDSPEAAGSAVYDSTNSFASPQVPTLPAQLEAEKPSFYATYTASGGSADPFKGSMLSPPTTRRAVRVFAAGDLSTGPLAGAGAVPTFGQGYAPRLRVPRLRELGHISFAVLDDTLPAPTQAWQSPLRLLSRRSPFAGVALLQTTLSSTAITGTASITLGALTSAATGTVTVTGALAVTLGAATVTATGAVAVAGTASIVLGALTLQADGSVGSTPITGQLSATLGTLSVSSTGVVTVSGAAAITLGALTVSATGTSGSAGITGALDATLGPLTASATGAVAITGTLTVTFGALTSALTGTRPGVTLGGVYVTSVTLEGRWE